MKALLIIDVQKEYMAKYPKILLKKINKRIIKGEEDKEIIIYIKNIRRLRSGDNMYDFPKEIKVVSNNIFYKAGASAFTNDELLNFLI